MSELFESARRAGADSGSTAASSHMGMLKDSLAPLLVSRLLSSAGIGFGQLALIWEVMSSGYGAQGLSVVLASNAFPALLIAGGGVLGDRFCRHHVLASAELLTCVVWSALAVVVLAMKAPLPLLCLLAALGGAAAAITLPALRGIVADLVPPEGRSAGNALMGQAQSIGLLVGLLFSGAAVTLIGPAWAALARGVLCGISALLLMRLTTGKPQPEPRSMLSDLREGWREFGSHFWLWVMTLQMTAITAAVVCYAEIIGPVYVSQGKGGALAWAVISACDPLGALAGAFIAVRWRPARPIPVVMLLPLSAAVPMLLLAGGGSWPLIAVGALVPGVLQAAYCVLWTTALQDTFRPGMLARINGWNLITGYSLMPIVILAAGPLGESCSLRGLAFGSGVIVIVATAMAGAILWRDWQADHVSPEDEMVLAWERT